MLVNDLKYWRYDRPEIEFEIRSIPFNKSVIEDSDDAQCHCSTNSCYFTDDDDDETIEKLNKNPAYKHHDLNSELFTVGIIFMILFLVIILSKGIILIHIRLKKRRVAPINPVRPSG